MKIVPFEPNRPVDVVLAADCSPVALPDGAGCLYPLADGRWLHLAAATARAMGDLKAVPGECLRVCLHVEGLNTFWTVERAGRQASLFGDRAPGPAVDRRRPAAARIPMNIAFREITAFVVLELAAAGEKWGPAAVQDMVSTLFIAADRLGYIAPWEGRPLK